MKRPDKHPEITAHMGQFIHARRKSLKLSLDAVAGRADCSKAHVWELENGRAKNPTIWMSLALCDALQCSLNELLGRDVSQPIFSADEMALIGAHRRIFATSTTEEAKGGDA